MTEASAKFQAIQYKIGYVQESNEDSINCCDGDTERGMFIVPTTFVTNRPANIKNYVLSAKSKYGKLEWLPSYLKRSVRAASVGDLDLDTVTVVDDVILVLGDRVLVRSQTDPTENGIYVYTDPGLTRASDALVDMDASLITVLSTEGTVNELSVWTVVDEAVLFGESLTFFKVTSGGAGIPGAPNNSVQFNNAGTLGGSADFLWNGTDLTVAQPVLVTNATNSTTSGTGALIVSGGVGIALDVVCDGTVTGDAFIAVSGADTAVLDGTDLDFQNGALTQAKMTATADTLTFEGTGAGTCLLTGLTLPGAPSDAANKAYVDSVAVGLFWKQPCVLATDAQIAALTGIVSVDGVNTSTGDRILVKNGTAANPNVADASVDNGIWIADDGGAWARSGDLPTGSDADGIAVFVTEGTVNADKGWVQASSPAIVGTNALEFVQFGAITPPAGVNGDIQINSSGAFGAATLSVFRFTDSATVPQMEVGVSDGTFTIVGTDATPATGHGGSDVAITTGVGDTTGAGGAIILTCGAGGATDGTGGSVTVTAGAGGAANGNGGVIQFEAGAESGTGTPGSITFVAGGSSATDTGFTFESNDGTALVVILAGSEDATAMGEGTMRVTGGASFTQSVYGDDFNATSDIRFKTNITGISDPLEKLRKVCGYEYDWSEKRGPRQLGVIAQQLEEIGLENIVTGSRDRKAVNYNALIPLIIEAVKRIADDLYK